MGFSHASRCWCFPRIERLKSCAAREVDWELMGFSGEKLRLAARVYCMTRGVIGAILIVHMMDDGDCG